MARGGSSSHQLALIIQVDALPGLLRRHLLDQISLDQISISLEGDQEVPGRSLDPVIGDGSISLALDARRDRGRHHMVVAAVRVVGEAMESGTRVQGGHRVMRCREMELGSPGGRESGPRVRQGGRRVSCRETELGSPD